jgi:predicted GNAT family N-acyltransferase
MALPGASSRQDGPAGGWQVRFAAINEILPLRQAVIIAGTDRDSPYFDGDDRPETRHVGVFDGGKCIGCATFLRSAWRGEPAYRARGMATRPDLRGRGIGRAMLRFAERELRTEADVIWCNAREGAARFYEKLGWTIVSNLFEIDGVGPHYTMVRRL